MNRIILAITIIATLAFTVASNEGAHAGADRRPHAHVVRKAERKLIRFTNHARRLHGLAPVRRDSVLHSLARTHTWAMERQQRLFHSGSLPCSVWGENIGVTGAGAWALHKAFMASPAHRANILNGRYRKIGVGAVRVGDALWVTVEFCGSALRLGTAT